jgi:hypothetical protein
MPVSAAAKYDASKLPPSTVPGVSDACCSCIDNWVGNFGLAVKDNRLKVAHCHACMKQIQHDNSKAMQDVKQMISYGLASRLVGKFVASPSLLQAMTGLGDEQPFGIECMKGLRLSDADDADYQHGDEFCGKQDASDAMSPSSSSSSGGGGIDYNSPTTTHADVAATSPTPQVQSSMEVATQTPVEAGANQQASQQAAAAPATTPLSAEFLIEHPADTTAIDKPFTPAGSPATAASPKAKSVSPETLSSSAAAAASSTTASPGTASAPPAAASIQATPAAAKARSASSKAKSSSPKAKSASPKAARTSGKAPTVISTPTAVVCKQCQEHLWFPSTSAGQGRDAGDLPKGWQKDCLACLLSPLQGSQSVRLRDSAFQAVQAHHIGILLLRKHGIRYLEKPVFDAAKLPKSGKGVSDACYSCFNHWLINKGMRVVKDRQKLAHCHACIYDNLQVNNAIAWHSVVLASYGLASRSLGQFISPPLWTTVAESSDAMGASIDSLCAELLEHSSKHKGHGASFYYTWYSSRPADTSGTTSTLRISSISSSKADACSRCLRRFSPQQNGAGAAIPESPKKWQAACVSCLESHAPILVAEDDTSAVSLPGVSQSYDLAMRMALLLLKDRQLDTSMTAEYNADKLPASNCSLLSDVCFSCVRHWLVSDGTRVVNS